MSRSVTIDIDGVLNAAIDAPTGAEDIDEATERILVAAAELFALHGIQRCSVEDIARHSGVGRTTVYRRFENRNQIVQAVLARECRRFFASIIASTDPSARLEDQVVEAFLSGLHAAATSMLTELVRTQPELLRLLTVDAAPVISAATGVLTAAFGPVEGPREARQVAAVAELLVRLAISVVVSGPGVVPMQDDAASRRALHELLDPLLVPLGEIRVHRNRGVESTTGSREPGGRYEP